MEAVTTEGLTTEQIIALSKQSIEAAARTIEKSRALRKLCELELARKERERQKQQD